MEFDAVEQAVADLLTALDADEGEHTKDTPRRVAAAWKDQLWGYTDEPAAHLMTTFPAPADPGIIIQAGIDVQSICAHHLLPFGGHATVAYRPHAGQDIVGLSKLTRLVYGYAARLQVQERIGSQVVTAIMETLMPRGAMAIITCQHSCIRLRGVRSPNSDTTTVAMAGSLSGSDTALIHQLHARGLMP